MPTAQVVTWPNLDPAKKHDRTDHWVDRPQYQVQALRQIVDEARFPINYTRDRERY